MASLKKKIEDEHDRQLTTRQMTFARHIVEGIYSNAEAARKAGYSHDIARNDCINYLKVLKRRVNSLPQSMQKKFAPHWVV